MAFRATPTPVSTTVIKVIERVEVSKVKTRPNYTVTLVMDVSGSMAGAKSAAVYKSMVTMVSEVLVGGDSLGVILFNDTVTVALEVSRFSALSFPEVLRSYLKPYNGTASAAFRCGAGTALWDAVGAGMDQLSQRPDSSSHPYLVVMTDGNDTSSKVLRAEIVQSMLEKPGTNGIVNMSNFHASFMSVGEAGHAALDRVVSNKPHLVHIKASDETSQIAGMFRKVTKEIRRVFRDTVKETTTVTTSTVEVSGAGGSIVSGAAATRVAAPAAAAAPVPASARAVSGAAVLADRKSTRLNSSHEIPSRMPSSA